MSIAIKGPKSNWGQPIAYHPLLAKFLGSVNAAILFGQLAYWEPRATENRGLGVYKSVQQWTDETGLSYREQVTARRILVDAGFLVETNKRLEHRIYFRIEWDCFNEEFEAWSLPRGSAFAPDSANCETAFGESFDDEPPAPEPHAPNDDSALRGMPKRRSSIGAETTAETTAESRAAAAAPAATTKAPKPRAGKLVFACPEGVDAAAWDDFMLVRKSKRAPMTQTALDGLQREADKAGLSLNDAVRACVELNWQNFNAGWYAERNQQRNTLPARRPSAQGAATNDETTLAAMRKFGIGGDFIDMED